MGSHPRQISTPRRRAMLIINHPDDIALTCQPQYGPQKILASRAIDPACPEDHVRGAACSQRLLPCEFARTIDAGWPRNVFLEVGPILRSVENIVSRKVDDSRANGLRLLPNRAHSIPINRVGKLRLALCLINCRVSRRIHYPARTHVTD